MPCSTRRTCAGGTRPQCHVHPCIVDAGCSLQMKQVEARAVDQARAVTAVHQSTSGDVSHLEGTATSVQLPHGDAKGIAADSNTCRHGQHASESAAWELRVCVFMVLEQPTWAPCSYHGFPYPPILLSYPPYSHIGCLGHAALKHDLWGHVGPAWGTETRNTLLVLLYIEFSRCVRAATPP